MDSTSRPTGCPCGEGILNKPKNGTSCHLPANRKFLFHAHFSLQKDFFSNFLSPWFMYFVTESSCFHLVLNLISKEQQKGKIFQFKKIICLQRGAASCRIIWELDVYSFCQLTTPAIRIGRPLLIFADHIFNSNLPLGSHYKPWLPSRRKRLQLMFLWNNGIFFRTSFS